MKYQGECKWCLAKLKSKGYICSTCSIKIRKIRQIKSMLNEAHRIKLERTFNELWAEKKEDEGK